MSRELNIDEGRILGLFIHIPDTFVTPKGNKIGFLMLKKSLERALARSGLVVECCVGTGDLNHCVFLLNVSDEWKALRVIQAEIDFLIWDKARNLCCFGFFDARELIWRTLQASASCDDFQIVGAQLLEIAEYHQQNTQHG